MCLCSCVVGLFCFLLTAKELVWPKFYTVNWNVQSGSFSSIHTFKYTNTRIEW